MKYLYEFGPFRLDEAERRLLRDDQPVVLTVTVFDTLLVLVKRSGQLIEREELYNALWPESKVEDANLTNNISTLRKALGDRPKNPQYIETVPKQGYRFVADVRVINQPLIEREPKVLKEAQSVTSLNGPSKSIWIKQQKLWEMGLVVFFIFALAVSIYWVFNKPNPNRGYNFNSDSIGDTLDQNKGDVSQSEEKETSRGENASESKPVSIDKPPKESSNRPIQKPNNASRQRDPQGPLKDLRRQSGSQNPLKDLRRQ